MSSQNMDITNYITINRRIFNHAFWKEHREYSKAEAWLDLLQQARFEVSEGKMLIGMSVIRWNRGEVIASVRFLVKRWSWSIGKVTRFLELLRDEKMITTRVDNGQTIIMIINYNLYNYIPEAEHQAEHQSPYPQRVSAKSRNTLRNSTDTAPIQHRYETNIDNIVNKENKKEANASVGDNPPTLLHPEKDLMKEYSVLVKGLKTDTTAELIAAKKSVFEFIRQNAPAFIEPYVFLWNIYASQNNCPKVQHITDNRKKKFKTRIQEPQFNFIEILTKAKDSQFLNGSTFFSFDWILDNQENYTKILEGNYNNKSKQQSHANNQQSTEPVKNGNHGKSAGAIRLIHSLAADLGIADE